MRHHTPSIPSSHSLLATQEHTYSLLVTYLSSTSCLSTIHTLFLAVSFAWEFLYCTRCPNRMIVAIRPNPQWRRRRARGSAMVRSSHSSRLSAVPVDRSPKPRIASLCVCPWPRCRMASSASCQNTIGLEALAAIAPMAILHTIGKF